VPCGAINDLDEVFADPQVLARAMTDTVAHPLKRRCAWWPAR
jgi:crotonobetainyl-CoA:carnitine CoA-transferase CaiB-like acyl-CoA transferase